MWTCQRQAGTKTHPELVFEQPLCLLVAVAVQLYKVERAAVVLRQHGVVLADLLARLAPRQRREEHRQLAAGGQHDALQLLGGRGGSVWV